MRRGGQRAAAEIGGYGAIFQLGHPSPAIRGEAGDGGRARLVRRAGRDRGGHPAGQRLHPQPGRQAHDPPRHLAAGLATVEALRSLPLDQRPWQVVGIEGWRNLDWLPDDEKVLLDVSGYGDLADRLAAVFVSQLEDGKRYDLAERGRRLANATLLEPVRGRGGRRDHLRHGPDPAGPQRRPRPGGLRRRGRTGRFQVDAEAAIARIRP